MRWIFCTLLLLNGVLFLWQWQQRDVLVSSAPVESVGVALVQDAPQLVLLEELAEGELAAMQAQKELLQLSAAQELEEEKEASLCTLVGPFDLAQTGENFVERMQALEIAASLQEVEIEDGAAYWVYLESEVSKKAALRRLHELQAKGIDSYVIPKGALANGISFGMFSQHDLAVKRQEAMKSQGYSAGIKEIKRSHKEVWAILAPAEALKVGDELWFELLNDVQGMERRENFCPGVASS